MVNPAYELYGHKELPQFSLVRVKTNRMIAMSNVSVNPESNYSVFYTEYPIDASHKPRVYTSKSSFGSLEVALRYAHNIFFDRKFANINDHTIYAGVMQQSQSGSVPDLCLIEPTEPA